MSQQLFEMALANLKHYWGFDNFRPGQDDVVRSVLQGNETLVLFPTGGGKSLCYQVPATVLPGLTLVISPLVALMQDQVDQLQSKGISSTFVNSTLSKAEVEQRFINASNGMYKLFYCAPERLVTPWFQNEAPRMNIQLVAVDEAHCISEWGHDFRPPYRQIRQNIETAIGTDVRWMALTATATPRVSKDISDVLQFHDPVIITKGFERKNLKWWVDFTEQKTVRLLQMIQKAPGSGLIYAGTRRVCNELAELLRTKGISCEAYHAGLPSEERSRIQHAWIQNHVKVVVATNAFGMGIDKSDCRFVIHYDMSPSLEAYYQEAGRAGRDGLESYPTLLVNPSDIIQSRKRISASYPQYETVKQVYTILCDMLHLAIGSYHEEPEIIDVKKLSDRCGLSVSLVRSSLRVMHRLGIIEMIEVAEPRLGIKFEHDREQLLTGIENFKSEKKRSFTDALVRLFLPEALNMMHFIELGAVISRLNVTYNMLIKGLGVLKSEGLLSYMVRDEDPMIQLLEPRSASPGVTREQSEKLRNIQLDKLEKIIGYTQTTGCRSYYIRKYFGEVQINRECGFCDLCLRRADKARGAFSQHELDRVIDALRSRPVTLEELVLITTFGEEKIKSILKWLASQQKVIFNRTKKQYRLR